MTKDTGLIGRYGGWLTHAQQQSLPTTMISVLRPLKLLGLWILTEDAI